MRAAELAVGVAEDEPAATFFAFAGKRRAFPFAWKLMADILTRRQAESCGLRRLATRDAPGALCVEVLHRRAGFEAVRGWFRARLVTVST